MFIFLIVVFSSFVLVFFYDSNTLSVRESLRIASFSKVDNVDTVLSHVSEDIEMLAVGNPFQDVFNQELDYSLRIQQLDRRMSSIISYHSEFTSIDVVSKDGYIISSTLNSPGSYIGNYVNLDESLEGLSFGKIFYDERLSKKILPISNPILLNEEIQGFLIVNYNFSHIDKILDGDKSLGAGSEIYILDENSFVITNLLDVESDDLYPIDSSLYSELKNNAEDRENVSFLNTKDYSGSDVLMTMTKSSVLDWYLVCQLDQSEILKPVYLFAGLEVGLIILILLLSVVGSSNISSRVSEPIEKLAENVSLVASGDLKEKLATNTPDEIGVLSKEIDNMAEAISESKSEIEEIVNAQTKELEIQKEKLRNQQLALLNILEDVSLEKSEIERQRNKLDIILDGIGDGVFAINEDGFITRFNKVASDISGFSLKDTVGKHYKDVLVFRREKDDSLYYDFIEDAMKLGKVQNMSNHTYLEKKDSSRVSVADSAAPIKSSAGKILGCVVVFRDVTRENEINKMKDEFVSVASHQLRTPLTGIKWYIQLLLKKETGVLNKGQRDFLKNIYESNERMIKLVDDLLSVSRIDTGRKFEIKKKRGNIVKHFKNVIKAQTIIAKKKDVSIVCQKSCPSRIMVNVDLDKIVEVFANVISNAVKYSKPKGKVYVSVKENKKDYVFSVKDEGLGIPDEVQDKIFDKFFRADNVKKHQVEGNGLGLYIARSIMEAHGGEIWFKSKVNKGSTFYIKIPK